MIWPAAFLIASFSPPLSSLPPNLPKGDYRLVMGLYNIANGERPPLTEGAAADPALDGPNAVLLDTISLP